MASRYPIIAILALLLYGCGTASSSPTPGLVTDSTAAPEATRANTEPPPIPGLSAEGIRNAQYQLGATDALRLVQLTNGVFQQGEAGSADFVDVRVTDFAALGDLNDDGVNEAAALVAENYGGTGVFVFLAVYTEQNDAPLYRTSAYVDDRPIINAIAIENNEVFLDVTIHGFEEPMCCPTFRTTRRYRLDDNQLTLTSFTSLTPSGQTREIVIESPANSAEVYGSVRVQGSVTIAPFENNLVYRILDAGGVELTVGSITVSAPSAGAPGTFDKMIELDSKLSGTTIRIEIRDLNAADGSLFAMDSLELVVK